MLRLYLKVWKIGMENNYTIKMTPKAVDDLDNIYRYISEELFATSSAINMLDRIEKEIIGLRKFPFSCNCIADEYIKNKGYRKLIVDNYIVFYLINEVKEQDVLANKILLIW